MTGIGYRFSLLLFAVMLSGCGGGGASSGNANASTTSIGQIKGGAFVNSAVTSSDFANAVSAYSFLNGARGSLVSAAPLISTSYTLPISANSEPVELVLSHGCYGGATQCVDGSEITAMFFYTAGATETVYVTPLTHVAAALAKYRISIGWAPRTAIDSANAEISQIYGFDILHTAPTSLDIGASATATYEYDVALASIGEWVYNQATAQHATYGIAPYTALNFVDLMYKDVVADGLLDGFDKDTNQLPRALAFGAVPLNTNVYRHQLAVQMTADIRSWLSATPSAQFTISTFLSWLINVNNSVDGLYGTAMVVPLDEGGPSISIIGNAGSTVSGSYMLIANVTDIVGLPIGGTVILIDGVYYTGSADAYAVRHLVNTTIFPNGWHDVQVQSTNLMNDTTTSTIRLNFFN